MVVVPWAWVVVLSGREAAPSEMVAVPSGMAEVAA
jgi:hypothetical protein